VELLVDGAELLVDGAELLVDGAELLVDGADELLTAGEVPLDVTFGLGLGLGLGGGACSAGTAPAPVNGVILACCALAALDGASDPVAAGVEVFLTADPMAKAATSPITRAAANSSHRLRTSCLAGGDAIAATSLPDINELSI
jgi:hypothetical protein